MKKRVAIIGGGIGGLACSIYLAKSGYEVFLFEKNNSTGGKASEIRSNGFRFDTGPTLITMPFVIKDLFDSAGEKIEDYLTLIEKDVVCKYFFNDGSVFLQYRKQEKLLNEFNRFSYESGKNFLRYLDYVAKIYNFSAKLFLFTPFEIHNILSRISTNDILKIFEINPFQTVHKANSKYFNDRRLIQLFDRYTTYVGSNPYQTSATYNIIPYVEYFFGSFTVKEGIFKIVEALNEVAKKIGVRIFTNSNVDQILFKDKVVNGIKVNGEAFYSNIVVSNADLIFTYEKLLKDFNSPEIKRYQRQEKSTSAIIFYFGVKGTHNQLEMDNILFSDDYKNEFEDLFLRKKIPDDPTIHIHISSRLNPGDAPSRFENWYMMINVPALKDLNFDLMEVRSKIISKINRSTGIDLTNKITFEKVILPADIELLTSASDGSLYGPSANNLIAPFIRQKNKSRVYEKLYFCGGTVHPGGGIPLVILSGKITSDLIFRYEE